MLGLPLEKKMNLITKPSAAPGSKYMLKQYTFAEGMSHGKIDPTNQQDMGQEQEYVYGMAWDMISHFTHKEKQEMGNSQKNVKVSLCKFTRKADSKF